MHPKLRQFVGMRNTAATRRKVHNLLAGLLMAALPKPRVEVRAREAEDGRIICDIAMPFFLPLIQDD